MAFLTNTQTIKDSNDVAVIKISNVFDGSGQETGVTKIDVSALSGALNVNNKIMVANTHPKSSYRTTIRKITYSVTDGQVRLEWQNQTANNRLIWPFSAGQGTLDFATLGGAATIPQEDAANTNGDILVTTKGMVANSAYAILIELKKDARDFHAGQFSDPAAFNR